MFERGQRVDVRDHQWEILDVRNGSHGTLLEMRRLSDGSAAPNLTLVPALEPSLRLAPAQALRFEIGNPVRLQQLHDALRLTVAHGRGDLVALDHGRIALEAYQLVPALKALRLPRARLLLADDVGLGKTIEAGLILLELARRGRAGRVLVACPAALTDQWVEELAFRFNLEFTKVDGDKWAELRRANPTSHSPWTSVPFAVSSIDYLKRNLGALHQAPAFDLVIVDEAHHVARSYAGTGRSAATDRSRLAQLLAQRTRELLLLSATPHNGYAESFASLLQLLEPHLAADGDRLDPQAIEPYLVRRLKRNVARGNPPRPVTAGRNVEPIEVTPSPREQEVFRRLRGHSQRTLRALKEDRGSYQVEAFALEVLRKRALSSPFALAESLERRRTALADPERGRVTASQARVELQQRWREDSELGDDERVEAERQAVAALAERMGEDAFAEERRLVDALRELVAKVSPEDDTKLVELRQWLTDFQAQRPGERVIVFTEFVDTVTYLERHLGLPQQVRVDGTMPLRARKEALQGFANQAGAVLLATDAAGEGLNLQEAAATVIHYELPWNPNRLEQRNGRVDRYGQSQLVEVRYLHLKDTRDAEILVRLQEKLRCIQDALGSASDVLGLANQPELLEALLEGDDEAALVTRIDQAAAQVRAYLEESGALSVLAGETFGPTEAQEVGRFERNAAVLAPDFADYTDLVRRVVTEERGRFVAAGERLWRVTPGPVLASYRGVGEQEFLATFDRAVALAPEHQGVGFLTPAHPLVRAVLQRVRARLWSPAARDRVAVRVVADEAEAGYLFTFTGRVQDDAGELLEEPMLAVRVAPDGVASSDPAADERRFRARPLAGDGAAWAQTHLAGGFDRALAAAATEAAARLQGRVDHLAVDLERQARRLRDDLTRWRDAERAAVSRHFQDGEDDQAQLTLFAEQAPDGALRTIDEALAAVDQAFSERAAALGTSHQVSQVSGPEPVGCLLLVPEAVCS